MAVPEGRVVISRSNSTENEGNLKLRLILRYLYKLLISGAVIIFVWALFKISHPAIFTFPDTYLMFWASVLFITFIFLLYLYIKMFVDFRLLRMRKERELMRSLTPNTMLRYGRYISESPELVSSTELPIIHITGTIQIEGDSVDTHAVCQTANTNVQAAEEHIQIVIPDS